MCLNGTVKCLLHLAMCLNGTVMCLLHLAKSGCNKEVFKIKDPLRLIKMLHLNLKTSYLPSKIYYFKLKYLQAGRVLLATS
jgi:hypothetical protein